MGFFDLYKEVELEEELPGGALPRGVLLTSPMFPHEHFSLYVVDTSVYSTAKGLLAERMRAEGVGARRLLLSSWDGPPRLFRYKGERVLRLPRLFLTPLQGLQELVVCSPYTLRLECGATLGVYYDVIREHSLFYPATPIKNLSETELEENKKLFKGVRHQLLRQFKKLVPSLVAELRARQERNHSNLPDDEELSASILALYNGEHSSKDNPEHPPWERLREYKEWKAR